jgi:hypothetical protein
MKKQLIPALVAAMFAIGGMSVYAADPAKPATNTSQPVNAAGAHPEEPGYANDPASAEKKQTGKKKGVKTGGLPPCSGQGAAVKSPAGEAKCTPEATAAVPGNQGAPTAMDKAKPK